MIYPKSKMTILVIHEGEIPKFREVSAELVRAIDEQQFYFRLRYMETVRSFLLLGMILFNCLGKQDLKTIIISIICIQFFWLGWHTFEHVWWRKQRREIEAGLSN